ncbi:MAG: ABC transporter permease [Gammaproteobacteria bacterium]
MNPYAPPVISRRAGRFFMRNFLVWRKLMISSITTHLIEPVVFTIGFGLGIGALVGEVDGVSYLQYIAAGMAGYTVMNGASFEALYSAYTRMHVQRNWDAVLHAPMALDDIVAGEWLWAGVKSAVAGTAMLGVLSALGLVAYPSALLLPPVMLLAGMAFSSLALICTACARGYELFSFYFTLFITPMMLLSGAFFPVQQMPEALQAFSAFLPLRHFVEIARPLLAGEIPPFWALNLTALALYAAGGLWLAMVLTRRRFSA